MSETQVQYPKAGPVGGCILRKVVGFLRQKGVNLPIASDILIATSGGSDSVGLAHLLTHFGRRIVAREKITILHINHGWRGNESDGDEEFVKELAQRWGVPLRIHQFSKPNVPGASLENEARKQRKSVYRSETQGGGGWVFTAHHADDLAETVLWRLCTGAGLELGGGILFQYERELRPFLLLRKTEIQDYLAEVGQPFREDRTNLDQAFLRSRMRKRLMPELELLFPKAVPSLVDFALTMQKRQGAVTPSWKSHADV